MQSVFASVRPLLEMSVKESVIGFAFRSLLKMAVTNCITEAVFSYRLRQSLLFVKLQTFTVNDSDRVCKGICFYKVQTFAISGSYKDWARVCF